MKNDALHAKVTMRVGGAYTLGALGTKHVIDQATPLVCEAIDAMSLPEDGFTFCDMGCADGATSIGMITARDRNGSKTFSATAYRCCACRPTAKRL